MFPDVNKEMIKLQVYVISFLGVNKENDKIPGIWHIFTGRW